LIRRKKKSREKPGDQGGNKKWKWQEDQLEEEKGGGRKREVWEAGGGTLHNVIGGRKPKQQGGRQKATGFFGKTHTVKKSETKHRKGGKGFLSWKNLSKKGGKRRADSGNWPGTRRRATSKKNAKKGQ